MLFVVHRSVFACTGFLVSARSHFLTAQHCISTQAAVNSLEVAFDYETQQCGGTKLQAFSTYAGDRLILADSSLDLALLTLNGNPALQHGFLALSDRRVVQDEALYLPQHPGGGPKKVSVIGCSASVANTDAHSPISNFGHQCDTDPGSSGSPVLDAGNRVVGVHTIGACTLAGGDNQAVVISPAFAALPPQRSILTLESAQLAFGASGSSGTFRMRGRISLGAASDGIMPLLEAVTVTLSVAGGPFYSATIPAGVLRRNGSSSQFLDSSGHVVNGITSFRVTPRREFEYGVSLGVQRVNLGPVDGLVDGLDVTVAVEIGNDAVSTVVPFRARPHALLFP
jgi:Trypsin-like peptidase domain